MRAVTAVWISLLTLGGACAPIAPLAPAPTPAEALHAELAGIFADPGFEHATWGVMVRSLERSDTIFRLGSERLVMPASNMKLVTGAAALDVLGPEYLYRTEIAARGALREGVLEGDLVVLGVGDPTISSRFHEAPDAVFQAWADSLRAHGVHRVTGQLVGDEGAFDGVPWGRGWAFDFLDRAYAAGSGALTLEEGAVEVRVQPAAAAGQLPEVELRPGTAHFILVNDVVTGEAGGDGTIDAEHLPDGSGLRVFGSVPAEGSEVVRRYAAPGDPAAYFLAVLRETLEASGIEVEGGIRRTRGGMGGMGAVPVFYHHSAPVAEIVPAFMLPSQNQIAELVFRTLGVELRRDGSVSASRQVVGSILAGYGHDPAELIMWDGSGLTRYNYLTADFLSDLLERMAAGPHAEVWMASLPVAGESGTLRNRMLGTPAEGVVVAKTGTISNARALSGYVTTADGERLVFSMIANNHRRSAADVDQVVERALVRLAEFRRTP